LLTSTTNASICANQLPYIWNGNPYTIAGTYIDTLPGTTGGCDTVATLNLVVTPLLTSTTNASICANQLPYIWNGNPYTIAGTYIDTLPGTTGGCDTVATLNLVIKSLLTSTRSVTICANSLPYIWYGNTINAAGIYTDTIMSTTGSCDTIATLNLSVNPVTTSMTRDTICANFLPYAWNGNSYPAAGTYSVTLQNSLGCDSIATLILTVKPIPVLVINQPQPVCAPMTVNLTDPSIIAGSDPGSIVTYWMDSAATIPLANPASVGVSGTYYIKALGANSCFSTKPVAVNVLIYEFVSGVRYPAIAVPINTPTQLSARSLGVTYLWSPPAGLNSTSIKNPIFNYDRQTQYFITITRDNGCVTVDTLLVKVTAAAPPILDCDVFVPKAWSPNNDGHNDKLYPLSVNIKELKYFRIFNRWGQLVFETNIIGRGWDGMFNGKPAVPDAYTWTVEAVCLDGKPVRKAGKSVLLR